MSDQGCELCGDIPVDELHLHARCHITAPLRVELHTHGDKRILRVFCYVPDCNRHVADFEIADGS